MPTCRDFTKSCSADPKCLKAPVSLQQCLNSSIGEDQWTCWGQCGTKKWFWFLRKACGRPKAIRPCW